MSQKITPYLLVFFLLPVIILGCSLFQSKPNTVDQEWTSYATELFTINVPNHYLGAQPGTDDVKVISDWMRENGYNHQGFEAFVEANSSSLLYTAYNTNVGKSGGLTQLTLAGGQKTPDFNFEEYVDFYIGLITGDQYKLIGHEQRNIGDKKVDVVIYDEQVGDSIFTDEVYIFETSNRFWKFEFFAPQDEFRSQTEEFERIVLKFEPNEK